MAALSGLGVVPGAASGAGRAPAGGLRACAIPGFGQCVATRV